MLSRALRRPLSGARLHRTVRFARKYNGQNETPHTTYFQQPPQLPRSKRSFLGTTFLALTFFGLGFVASHYVDYEVVVLEDDDGEVDDLRSSLEVDLVNGLSPEDAHRILKAHYQIKQAIGTPYTDLKLAQAALDFGKGFASSRTCASHSCQLPSNLPCEDTEVGGEYTYSSDREKNWSFHCIFDGHAGPRTSHVLPDMLPGLLGEKLHEKGLMDRKYVPDDPLIIQTIKQAFTDVDDILFDKAREAIRSTGLDMSFKAAISAPALSGSCALVALFDPVNAVLRVANTGDSRAVLGRWDGAAEKYIAMPMSVDQTGFNPDEVRRLRSEHPGEDPVDPKTGRVFGLAVSRAFGDARWKWPNEFTQYVHEKLFGPAPRPNSVIKTPPYLTAEPEVMETQVQTGKKPDFLIMASDGLWDNISSENAVVCVQQWLNKFNPTAFAERGASAPVDDVLQKMPLTPVALDSSTALDSAKDEDTYYDESERCMRWRVSPKHFIVEDDNCGLHLIKNALGGSRRNLFCGIMGVPAPQSRSVRDDITVHVLFFGVDVKLPQEEERFRQERLLQANMRKGKSVEDLQQ